MYRSSRACQMREEGMGDDEIKLLGRWNGGQKAYLAKREHSHVRTVAKKFGASQKRETSKLAKKESYQSFLDEINGSKKCYMSPKKSKKKQARREPVFSDEEFDLEIPQLVPNKSDDDEKALSFLDEILGNDRPKLPKFQKTSQKKRVIWSQPVNCKLNPRKRKPALPKVVSEWEKLGFDSDEFKQVMQGLMHACKRAKLKGERKRVSKTVFKTLQQLTEDLHRQISEEKAKREFSPGQRSVKNELKKLEPVPELKRQKAIMTVTPQKKPQKTFGKKMKKKWSFGPKKTAPIKLVLSPKAKLNVKGSPNLLNLKRKIDLSPKTLETEEADKKALKELAKTFYGESSPEKEEPEGKGDSPESSTPPISQD